MIKPSPAIASEVVLGNVIERLMRSAVAQAGAERGLLILLRGDQPPIEAEAMSSREEVTVTIRPTPVAAAERRVYARLRQKRDIQEGVLDLLRDLTSD